MNNTKVFWKSKTVVLAAVAFIAVLVDYFFGLGIAATINNGAAKILVTRGDEIQSIDFMALAALAFAIFMRFKSAGAVTTSAAKAATAQRAGNNKIIKDMEKQLFQIPEDLREPILVGYLNKVKKEQAERRAQKQKKEINQKDRNNGFGPDTK